MDEKKIDNHLRLLDNNIDRQRKTLQGLRERNNTQDASLEVVFRDIDRQLQLMISRIEKLEGVIRGGKT